MVKTSKEIEEEFLRKLMSSTEKDLHSWLNAIGKSPIKTRNGIIKWLKEQHKLGHLHASLLTGIYFNHGSPVYGSEKYL